MIKPKRGGARQGAGAPKKEAIAHAHTICMTDADWLKFKALGGVKFLRELLNKGYIK